MELQQWMHLLDKDADGKISFEEYMGTLFDNGYVVV